MEKFDKHMALGEIEDALTNLSTPHGRGVAIGLCSAFYMCGLLSADEWEAFMELIPADSREAGIAEIHGVKCPEAKTYGRVLN